MPESIVSVKVETPTLAGLVHELERAGRGDLRKELAKSLRMSADKIVRAEKDAVMGISSKAHHTKKQTARFAATELGGRKQVSLDKFFKTIEGAGLRRSIANSIERQIRYRGNDVGIRIRARSSKMPPGMERLPRLVNRGKWKHPFLGRRDIMVDQTVSPPQFWSKTGVEQHAEAKAEIEKTLRDFMAKLGHHS